MMRDGKWENGWYIPENEKLPLNEKLPFGYNIFDTDFYKKELINIISEVQSVEDLEFLNTRYKIPVPKVLYPSIDEKCLRSDDMGLSYRHDLSFAERLKYYKANKGTTQQTYVYNCYSDEDIALAELHYYISHGYKLTYCEMCKKPFFTLNLKNKFCRRKGENPQYPKYSCNHAQSLIRNKKSANNYIRRLRKSIINNLSNKSLHHEQNLKEREVFLKEDGIFQDRLKNCSEEDYLHLKQEYDNWIEAQYKKYNPKGRIKRP